MDKDKNPERVVRPPLVLTSENDTITLKRLTHEDALVYFSLIDTDRAHLSQHGDSTADKYRTLEDVEKSIDHPDPKVEEYRFGVWDNGEMVGFVKLKRNKDDELETGSWVSSSQTDHGYAHRARLIALRYAFDKLGADRVVSHIAVGNHPSRVSVEKSGYGYVGEEGG